MPVANPLGLLETLLFKLNRFFGSDQPYLEELYKALFALAYYGLMRISEITLGEHTLKTKDSILEDFSVPLPQLELTLFLGKVLILNQSNSSYSEMAVL